VKIIVLKIVIVTCCLGAISLSGLQYHDSEKAQSKSSATINQLTNTINYLTNQIAQINANQLSLLQQHRSLLDELATNTLINPDMRQRIIESNRKFEVLDSQAEDLNVWIQKGKEKLALTQIQHEKEHTEELKAVQSQYARCSPYYNYAINTLVNMLSKVATHYGDRASSNFQGLPASIDFDVAETNLAEIKFQTNTDWNFQVLLGARRTDHQRTLTIRGKSGFIDMEAGSGGDQQFRTWVHFSGEETIFNSQPFTNYKATIDDALQELMAFQLERPGFTNKVANP
jgi:hypothetical protein